MSEIPEGFFPEDVLEYGGALDRLCAVLPSTPSAMLWPCVWWRFGRTALALAGRSRVLSSKG